MTPTETQFVTDEEGRRVAVLLSMERYRELLEAWEDVEASRAFDEAKASGDEAVPFDQAVAEIERGRR